MKTTIKILSLSLLAIFVITSCKKKTEVGPQGPQGSQGIQGETGNANVVSTYTIALTSWSLAPGSYAYSSEDVNLPKLDSAAYYGGTIISYYYASTTMSTMPYSDGVCTFMPEYSIGSMRVLFYFNNHSTPFSPGGAIVRVVIIPPAVKLQYPGFDFSNYSKVKETFNLKD